MNWPCGHPKTPENSQRVGSGNGVRCRECRRRIARESAARCSKDREVNYLAHRVNYLPTAIYHTREKLAKLEAEARSYGMLDLIA